MRPHQGKAVCQNKKLQTYCYQNRFNEKSFERAFTKIKEIYLEIVTLAENFPIEQELDKMYYEIKSSEANLDYVLSRGEYLNAKIMAHALEFKFLDASKFIRFNKGELDLQSTIDCAKEYVTLQGVVIPGFYGVDEYGHIKTFSRGGSDITGSVVARAFQCDLYENWTDVDGIHVCDPKIVTESKRVSQISFRELREMSYMGASVLHAETLLPLHEYPIPIHLKSSFYPTGAGTKILKKRTELSERETITCITGKNDYTCIQISKAMLDKQLGFVKKATEVFERYNINISHTHSGLDNLCFFVEQSQYKEIAYNEFLLELKNSINADKIKGYEKIALLAVVGHNLSRKIGILASIFNALRESEINVKTIYQSVSECNIIIGIENEDLKKGIRALYNGLLL